MPFDVVSLSCPFRVKRRGARHFIESKPSGAEITIESTATKTISFPHEVMSVSLLLSIMDRGTEQRAACTVALGIQATETKRRSLNDSPLVATYAAITLAVSPTKTTVVPLKSSSFRVTSTSNEAPIVPNNNGLIAMFQITLIFFLTLIK